MLYASMVLLLENTTSVLQVSGDICLSTVEADLQGLLQAFVDYIRERKTVVLEDLAADFGLRVQVLLLLMLTS